MRSLTTLLAAMATAMTLAVALPAAAKTYYTINGQPAPYDVQLMMAQNGLPFGHYWLDTLGYWGVVGSPYPLGNIYAGTTISRYGSGEQASNGWSYWSDLSEMGVGGDANGCLYAGDWSNC